MTKVRLQTLLVSDHYDHKPECWMYLKKNHLVFWKWDKQPSHPYNHSHLLFNYAQLQIFKSHKSVMRCHDTGPDPDWWNHGVLSYGRETQLSAEMFYQVEMTAQRHLQERHQKCCAIRRSQRVCWRARFCCTCMSSVAFCLHRETKLNYCLEHIKMVFMITKALFYCSSSAYKLTVSADPKVNG